MKVLFLDHDGVICLEQQWGTNEKKQKDFTALHNLEDPDFLDYPVDVRFDDFDKNAVAVLNNIIDRTKSIIVITSDWKDYASDEELKMFYKSQGVFHAAAATTFLGDHIFNPFELASNKNQMKEFIRSKEITCWLENNPAVDKWVAVDDMKLFVTNFVHITDVESGLCQPGIEEAILSYLL